MFCIVVHGVSNSLNTSNECYLKSLRDEIEKIIRKNFPYSGREEILIFFPMEVLSYGISIHIDWIKYKKNTNLEKFCLELLDVIREFFPLPTPIKISFQPKCYVCSSERPKRGIVILE